MLLLLDAGAISCGPSSLDWRKATHVEVLLPPATLRCELGQDDMEAVAERFTLQFLQELVRSSLRDDLGLYSFCDFCATFSRIVKLRLQAALGLAGHC